MSFAGLVYILCFLTCATCAALLARAWVRKRTPLLLWTAASLLLLALNNFFVVTDLLIFPATDFSALRHLTALAAGATLIVGFIWEAE